LAQNKNVEAGKLFDSALSIFERYQKQENAHQKSSFGMALSGRAAVEFRKGNRAKALEINKEALVSARRMKEYLAAEVILSNQENFLPS